MKRLMALVLSLVMLAAFGAAYAGGDVETTPEEEKVTAFGIPTKEDLADLKADADAQWDEEDYSGAAEDYAELAEKAGWLYEIVAAVNAPLAGGEAADSAIAERVGKAESLAGEYFEIYKLALIRAGMGYYYAEDYEEALPYLLQALEKIDAADTENWILCAEAVMVIIGETEAPEAE